MYSAGLDQLRRLTSPNVLSEQVACFPPDIKSNLKGNSDPRCYEVKILKMTQRMIQDYEAFAVKIIRLALKTACLPLALPKQSPDLHY